MVEDLRKKFSVDAKISCVMQETKIFHQGPPSTGRFKKEILFRCQHFLCYARNENFSPSPHPSPLVLLYCTLNIENQAAQIEGGRFMEEKYYNRLRALLC